MIKGRGAGLPWFGWGGAWGCSALLAPKLRPTPQPTDTDPEAPGGEGPCTWSPAGTPASPISPLQAPTLGFHAGKTCLSVWEGSRLMQPDLGGGEGVCGGSKLSSEGWVDTHSEQGRRGHGVEGLVCGHT